MQILNLDADLNISRLDADIRTLRLGEGGTTNYNDLTNKPSINTVVLTGNKTTSDLNIKTSDLINDEGFITNADIPTKTSDLTNDSGFQTAAQVSSAVAAAIPTNVSSFTNDAGYITAAQVGNIPTKTSDLTNDSGFITSAEAPVQSVNGYTGAVSLDGSNLDYDAGNSINDKIDAVEASIPSKTSDLTNDSGFITAAGVPSKTSDLINDSGFITSADIPTDVSAFTNDAGYQTSADVNTLIQAAMPATETIENESIASFSDGADNVPVSELIVNITATQAGSGVPSPDNVREILGFDSGAIRRNNKNLISLISDTVKPNRQSSITINSISDNSINMTSGGLAYACFGRYVYLKAGEYIVSLKATASDSYNPTATIYKGSSVIVSGINNTTSKTFTVSTDDIYELRMFVTGSGDTTIRTVTYSEIQIEKGEDKTNFVAYNGNTYTFTFGQTVYGGTLNVTTGELTVTHGYIASYNGEAINEPWISSIDEYVPNTSPSTGAEVVYPLATPTTVQLTPTEVRTLLNDNNIFADTGDINKLVYFKTGCEAIARLIEAYT